MIGIVIVSHSHGIAEGVAELAREMGGPDVRLETAGGLDEPGHPIGTDAVSVMNAIERAWSGDGVLVLMDLGSAVLSAEMALELLPQERRHGILLCEAPLVEGAVAAAVTARTGASLETVAAEARGGLAGKAAHLGTPQQEEGARVRVPDGSAVTARLTIGNPHGLHARPAARFVHAASEFDAAVSVRNLSNGRGPADAASLNAIATLGATSGHEIEVSATGPGAAGVVAALRALAARNFDDEPEPPPDVTPDGGATGLAPGGDGALRGHAASPGIAIGPARRFHAPALVAPPGSATDRASELAALDRAIAETTGAIADQREEVASKAGPQEAEIFDAHLLFLRDDALLAPARRSIEEGPATAAQAWQGAVEATSASWDALEDPYLRARADDLRSVGTQVLARIMDVDVPAPRLDATGILVAEDLTPADTASLDPAVVLGIATARGGPTSHAAVLARSMGIPAVVGLGEPLHEVDDGRTVVLDGDRGEVLADPAPATIARSEAEREKRAAERQAARAAALVAASTTDGTIIEVAANVGTPGEVPAAVAAGADGVGLFRTEFLFMDRDAMPDEAEQEAAYREAAEALGGRPLLIRTLDAGADKPLPYLGQPPEPNPFLGVRGVRLGLARPAILATQLRAVLRVASDFPVRVMFPMVTTLHELEQALAILDEARTSVGDVSIEAGVMVEVPAAALTASALAPRVDFFSVGTNDLTQYTVAADRGNEHVAGLQDALHPAVLQLVHATVEAARAQDRWVGVCGELAADPAATELLLGIGVRELSMSAPAIAVVKERVRSVDLASAGSLAARVLTARSAEEVRGLLGG